MARSRKAEALAAPPPQAELVPLWWAHAAASPPAPVIYVRRQDVQQFLAWCTHHARATEAPNRQRKKSISEDRFRQGIMLLAWITALGGGKLTKGLVKQIRDGCRDWPCVRQYWKASKTDTAKAREALRNALRNLACATRRAIRDSRLPAGWSMTPPPT
jgi:hypothetical protein